MDYRQHSSDAQWANDAGTKTFIDKYMPGTDV